MGVIRKKTATRGGEGGVKYVCDVCSADITSTVSILFTFNLIPFLAFLAPALPPPHSDTTLTLRNSELWVVAHLAHLARAQANNAWSEGPDTLRSQRMQRV